MESLEPVLRLVHVGCFTDALNTLENNKLSASNAKEREILRAEILERIGRPRDALKAVTSVLKLRQTAASDKSRCEAVIGRVLFDDGNTDDGLAHLQRAALIAQQCHDLYSFFGAKLPILGILSDRSG